VGHGGHDHLVNFTNLPTSMWPAMPSADSREAPGGDGLTADESLILQQINAYRAANGEGPLTVNPMLESDASGYAGQLAALDRYGDDGVNGHVLNGHDYIWRANQVGYPWTYLGENVAWNSGYANPAQTLSDQWWNSPEHRANILNPNYTQIGVGVATSGSGKTYGDVVFGSTT
jgi:uncharacterized protein YkwD